MTLPTAGNLRAIHRFRTGSHGMEMMQTVRAEAFSDDILRYRQSLLTPPANCYRFDAGKFCQSSRIGANNLCPSPLTFDRKAHFCRRAKLLPKRLLLAGLR
jgi:hypothetical protein